MNTATKASAARQSVVHYLAGNGAFGIESRYIAEVLDIRHMSVSPDLPDHIKGHIQVRGVMVPVTDLRNHRTTAVSEVPDEACIVVIDIDGIQMGLLVDKVS